MVTQVLDSQVMIYSIKSVGRLLVVLSFKLSDFIGASYA